MNDCKLDYIKRKIKRNYKRYTGERTDGIAKLIDVVEPFNISIDEEREEDYIIKKIDYTVPSIEVIDTKNDISYKARYTCDADLLNYGGGTVSFNSLVSISPERKIESLYWIGEKEPIIIKMTFTDNDYELVFEKETPNNITIFSNGNYRMIVRYLQNVIHGMQNVEQSLLTKIYDKCDSDRKEIDSFEQVYGYGINNFLPKKDSQDKYTYLKNNNVIYGINELSIRDDESFLRGICFEKLFTNPDRYFPTAMYPKRYQMLKNVEVISAMIFTGVVSGSNYNLHNSLEIYKDVDKIYVKYLSNKHNFEIGNLNTEVVVNKEIDIPCLNSETISVEEIELVAGMLKQQYENDIFIELVCDELDNFTQKINIKNGLNEEKLDPLSPKLLFNKSFDEICELVSKNKQEYFDLITEQFQNITSVSKSKDKSKVLKLDNLKK